MTADTTVPVSDEVWKVLTRRKDRGDSFDDVLRRVLELDSDEDDEDDETSDDAVKSNTDAHEDAVESLDVWGDIDVDDGRARTETQRAVEWLRDSGERHTRQEFIDALAEDSPFGDRSWWERAVQPGLRGLDEIGVVEFRDGHHDYKWTN